MDMTREERELTVGLRVAKARAFAQLTGGTPNCGRACSAFYAALTGIPEATCRAPCATSRLACFCL